MNRSSSAFVLTATLTCLGVVATAQDEAPSQRSEELVAWAPEWRVGDWWMVKVYQPSIDLETAELNDENGAAGVPDGFAPTNRLLFQVDRRELVSYASDAPNAKPEAFLVVQARTLDGLRKRSVELWYTEEDMTLAKVVTSSRDADRFLTGTAQVRVDASGTLGVPLEWPDLRAAVKRSTSVRGHRNERIRQQVKRVGKRKIRVRLEAGEKAPVKRGPQRPTQPQRVLFDWQEGRPSWSRVRTRDRYAELVRFGKKRQLPRRYR